MMAVPLTHVLIFSMILFCIGLVGIFIRKDVLTIFLCVEILLNAANIVFSVLPIRSEMNSDMWLP
jgi:NADH-quinone oxidoreductase subunit K